MPLDTLRIEPDAVVMHPDDNVAIACSDLLSGSRPLSDGPSCLQRIARGHKMALRRIPAGGPIVKSRTIIGVARHSIEAGAHVHVHNLDEPHAASSERSDATFCRDRQPLEQMPPERRAVFQGIVRESGRVGTRNYIGIIATVNGCSTVARRIADHFNHGPGWLPGTIDGVLALTHASPGGMPVGSASHEILQRTIAGFASHPNFGGLMVIGLGPEAAQLERLLAAHRLAVAGGRLSSITIQDEGGSQSTIRRGIAEIAAMLTPVADVVRAPVDASHLTVGLQCGGSDAFSAITANPALGHAVDLLVRQGGTAILSETPEIQGVEHALTRRAETPEVAQALLDRITWWRAYTQGEPSRLHQGTSPDNDTGGLTTVTERSLGALTKGGSTNLRATYEYAQSVTERGLVFMDSPSFDPCSATGQIASGANLICFTTGRGSPFGSKPVPSIKLSTTSELFSRQREDMDLNCGTVLDGEESPSECGQRIFGEMLAVASGRRTCSEEHGYGDNEFVPWQIGPMT